MDAPGGERVTAAPLTAEKKMMARPFKYLLASLADADGDGTLDGGDLCADADDGQFVYAWIDTAAGPAYSAFRIGPTEAFLAAGSATATAWVDGAKVGSGVATRYNVASWDVETW